MADGTTEADIERIVNGANRAKDATEYAATLVFRVDHVADDDYKFVWSTEYNGGFKPDT